MATKTRPRWDEFLLAVFWTLAGIILLYFGFTGYTNNLAIFNSPKFSLPGFIISFSLLCMAVFGLVYALRVYGRLLNQPPLWLDNAGPLALGTLLLSGFGFSLFTIAVLILDLLNREHERYVLAWGITAIAALAVLAVYQILWSLNAFEPFLPWPNEFYNQSGNLKVSLPMALLIRLNSTQHALINHTSKFGYTLEHIRGPLLPEPDPKTTVVEEKEGGRPGLEKSLVSHGGWHVNTLGFTANSAVIFAVSDGGTVHFKAGGRKGMLFPPEIKFWEVPSDKVQTASLGQPYTFLTRNFQTPLPLQNYRFLVPASGGKFALVTPRQVRLGDWQNGTTHNFTLEEPLVLQGFNGFVPLAINPEGSKVAWCDAIGQTSYWNLENDRMQTLRLYPSKEGATTGQPGGVWGLVFSPDGTKIATIGAQGVLLQNVYTGWRWFAENNPERERLTTFAFNHNGFEMALGLTARPDAVKIPMRRSRYNNNYRPNQAAGESSEEPKWLNIVRIWDLRVPDYVDLLAGDEPIREIAFSTDNQMLAASDEAGLLRLWVIPVEGSGGRPPRLVAQVDLGITGRKTVLNFSPDMQRLVCATDNRVLIFNLERLRHEAAVETTGGRWVETGPTRDFS